MILVDFPMIGLMSFARLSSTIIESLLLYPISFSMIRVNP